MPLYRLLLRLYPKSFRLEYGGEMSAVFAEERRRVRGVAATAGLWVRAAGEVLRNATLVHAEMLRQDVAYTARTLRRSPGFATTAIVIVALGIGATTAAFSVTDFVLFRPLPYAEAHRLVTIFSTTPGYQRMELSPPNYRDLQLASRSFERFGVHVGVAMTLTGDGDARRLEGAAVSVDIFPVLRVVPAIGRTFLPEDDRDGAPPTIILAHGFWQRHFGGAADVVGRTLQLDGTAYTIIGVMPRGFAFPNSSTAFWTPNRFGPASFQPGNRTNNYLRGLARLQPGVTIDQARAELQILARQLEAQFPKENQDTSVAVFSLRDEVPARTRLLLLALSGAAGCLLLIACANLANLLLTRALGRRRELAVRTALGAGRERLVRQMLTESLSISCLGGVLGIALAVAAVPMLAHLVPSGLPLAGAPAVDMRVLLVAAALTTMTGLAFGLAPVVHARRGRDMDGLREGQRSGGGPRERLRSALVVVEVTASVALLICAGLLIRALASVRSTDPGFRAEGVLTLRTELPMPKYRTVAARDEFYIRVLDQVQSGPEVTAAGFISYLPMSSFRGGIWPVSIPGQTDSTVRGINNVASIRFVTPGFFAALGIPIRRGRDISHDDTRDRPYVAVVSESFATRYWPGDDPIGRRFMFAFAEREVVGVAADVRVRGLEMASEPQVYLSPKQVNDGSILFYMPKSLAIRTTASPERLVPFVREVMQRVEPGAPLFEVQTLDHLVGLETASRAAQARVLAAFAIIAFGLAAIGIHGLLSFAISQRTNEIGVRVALGATSADILWMVVSRGLALATAGIALGVTVAYVAGRSMEAVLAGVRPTDAPTILAAIAVAVVMTVAGTITPTLRALRVNPVTALRAD
jgi:predicted permease